MIFCYSSLEISSQHPFPLFSFLIKWLSHDLGFFICFSCFSRRLDVTCDCHHFRVACDCRRLGAACSYRHLGTAFGCRHFGTTFDCRRLNVIFICVDAI